MTPLMRTWSPIFSCETSASVIGIVTRTSRSFSRSTAISCTPHDSVIASPSKTAKQSLVFLELLAGRGDVKGCFGHAAPSQRHLEEPLSANSALLNFDVDNDVLLRAARDDHRHGLVGAGVNLLVHQVRRQEDEVARLRLDDSLQAVAVAEAGAAADHVDHALERAVVVRAGAHAFVDGHVPDPEDRKSTRLNSSHGYISYTLFFFQK